MGWFKGLKFKLLSMLAAGVLVIGGLVAWSTWALNQMVDQIIYLGEERIPLTDNVWEMRSSLNAVARFVITGAYEVDATRRARAFDQTDSRIQDFTTAFTSVANGDLSEQSRKLLSEVETEWKRIVDLQAKVRNASPTERQSRVVEFNIAGEEITKHLREMTTILDTRNKAIVAEAKSRAMKLTIGQIVLSAALILASLVLGLIFILRLVRALTLISDQVGNSSQEVQLASQQLAASAQQLSSATQEQAASIEESSSALHEISSVVENNVKGSEACVNSAEEVMNLAQKASSSMTETVRSMDQIKATNQRIEHLAKLIEQIGEKTELIDEIVFQTRLLSFNASIEAERAGEHGRGFAVVAQEVGRLAQMSGTSASEINSIFKDAIREAREVATQNTKCVQEGSDLCHETSTQIESMATAARDILDRSKQIQTASTEQSSGIRQVSDGVNLLSQATQEVAAVSEQAASSSEDLNRQSSALNLQVERLTMIIAGVAKMSTQADAAKPSSVAAVPRLQQLRPPTKLAAVKLKQGATSGPGRVLPMAVGRDSSWDEI